MELLLLVASPNSVMETINPSFRYAIKFASPVSLEAQPVSLELLEGQRPNYLGCFTLGPTSVI